MITLTKKYRVFWDSQKNIKGDYSHPHNSISVTYVIEDGNYFEADTLIEIESYITDNSLII